MTAYTIMHALAVASLWGIGGTLVLIVAAHVWGVLMKRDPAEFWMQKSYDTEETYRFASHYNRATESALPQIIGEDFEYRSFALDVDPRPDEAA